MSVVQRLGENTAMQGLKSDKLLVKGPPGGEDAY